MPTINLTAINGTPAFMSSDAHPSFGRAYGAIYDKDRQCYLFPAYPPFGPMVLSDLKKVVPGLTFGPSVEGFANFLKHLPAVIASRELPEGFTWHTPPFEHQVEGFLYLLHHPRFGLFWDPGTGKSKVIVDLKRALPQSRMLILTPPVTVRNWVREFAIHAGDSVTVEAIDGTAERKRRVISRYKDAQVLVTSYGTARTLGLPRMDRRGLTYIKQARAAGRQIADSGLRDLAKAVRVLSDPEDQARYLTAWAFGMPVSQVARAAREEAQKSPQWLEDIDFDILVCDESHNIKAADSQQTQTVLALSKKAARRYLMSGTPTLGSPTDLYPQMKFLSPAIFPEDWLKFSDMFLVRAPWNKRIVTGYKNLNILNGRVQRVAIRKKKEECLDLPERTIIDVPFELTGEQQRFYNRLVEDMGADLSEFFESQNSLEIQNAAVLLNKLTQVSSGFLMGGADLARACDGCPHLAQCVERNILPYTSACAVHPGAPPPSDTHFFKENPKLEALEELLDTLLVDPEHKTIIWGVHKAELNLISDLLDKRKYEYVRVDGSNSGKSQPLVERFNQDPACRVYLGQIATGIGITLNAATYTIYSSLDWSLGTYLQSIDRNYRAGQTKKVTVYRLIGQGTVDEYKARALSEKKDISTVLTNKIACATCAKRIECLNNNVELFDPGCLYQRSMRRTVARAKTLK